MKDDLSAPIYEKPTRVRFGVLAFACTLSMITYLDRVCIASVAPRIRDSLGLNAVEDLSLAFTAFAFAYAMFEIPTGWLGDVFGPRKTLIRIVLWWSVFTALTGFVGLTLPGGVFIGLASLIVIRFLFGVGEAGAYPNITRALHNWFPFQERGVAQGTVWFSGRLMGGLTPLILLVLIEGLPRFMIEPILDWRQAFWAFGVIGTIWCVLFAWWFRNRPEDKDTVNAAELALIGEHRHGEDTAHSGVPWRKLLTSRNLWALCLMYFCAAYGWYFNITYLPSFLEDQYGVEKTSLIGALYKGGPLWVGALACLTGGYLTDRFIRRTGNRKWGRRLFGVFGHSLCGLCYLACLLAPSVFWFFAAISLAAFFNDLTMGAAWATCQDIGRRYAAIVAGCMNTVGNLGGAAAGWLTGLILKTALASHAAANGLDPDHLTPAQKVAGHVLGYQINFISFAVVYAIAVVFWFWIDPTRPVAPVEQPAPAA